MKAIVFEKDPKRNESWQLPMKSCRFGDVEIQLGQYGGRAFIMIQEYGSLVASHVLHTDGMSQAEIEAEVPIIVETIVKHKDVGALTRRRLMSALGIK